MRNLLYLLVASALFTGQVADTFTSPAAAPAQASAQAAVTNTKISFNTQDAEPLDLEIEKPDFDTEILNPLRAKQAAERKRLAAMGSRRVATSLRVTGPLSPAAIQFLGMCESGMTPTRNSGNGYYGAFQFSIGTWNAMATGYARADLAPLEVQIEAVQKLLSRSSIFSQFPACARKMAAAGLL
jgi:hypothetical protein